MRTIFGGLIAVILLGIYVHLLRVAYLVVHCVNKVGCNTYNLEYFNDVMSQALTVIGGLVSALVITELAITNPGEIPAAKLLSNDASSISKSFVKAITVAYILTWIAAGLFAFFVGIYHPKTLPVLTGIGQSWLGLAVAAAYSYFGINPNRI